MNDCIGQVGRTIAGHEQPNDVGRPKNVIPSIGDLDEYIACEKRAYSAAPSNAWAVCHEAGTHQEQARDVLALRLDLANGPIGHFTRIV